MRQAAAILAVARAERVTVGPAIVVAPLSTIGAWERELAKWAPDLTVLTYIGGQAARDTIQRCVKHKGQVLVHKGCRHIFRDMTLCSSNKRSSKSAD